MGDTSDVRMHLSTSLRSLSTRALMVADTARPENVALRYADKIQVHICDLMFGARAMAVIVHAKARNAYEQASEMDGKSALTFAALAAIPAVAMSISHTRRFLLAALTATVVVAANLVFDASPRSDESTLQLGTGNPEAHSEEHQFKKKRKEEKTMKKTK